MTIRLEGVGKVFEDGTEAVRDVDLEAAEGEFLVLVGPSGSGKSTILRMVAGLDSPTGGRIHIGGRDVTELEPQRRDVAMVFQSYALYPHKTVRENLGFGLRVRGHPREDIRRRVEEVARTLGIREQLARKPAQLSGGQRQRVALGRAIVREPRAFLLDEPLSNLDPELRHHTRSELARLHRRLGITTLYVTHDQEEAMTLGNRVAVLRDGGLEQVAPPMELYRAPATRFVATFIGSPAMNLFRCRVRAGPEGVRLAGQGVHLRLSGAELPAAVRPREEVLLGVRPQDLRPATEGEQPHMRGIVDLVEPRGSDIVVRLELQVRSADEDGDEASGSVSLVLPPETRVAEGDRLGARLLQDRLHLFDPRTEMRLR